MRLSYFTSSVPYCGIRDYSENLRPELEKLCEVKHLGAAWPNTLGYYRELGRRANDADILHLEYEPALFSVAGNERRNGLRAFLAEVSIPIVVTFHGGLYQRYLAAPRPQSLLRLLRRWIGWQIDRSNLAGLLKRSSYVSVFSAAHRDLLISLGASPQKVEFRFHPIPPVHSDVEAADRVRRKCDLGGKFALVLAGFIHPQKGYEVVAEILPQLPAEAVVVIAGEAAQMQGGRRSYEETLRELFAAKGVESRVRWLGPLDRTAFLAVLAAGDLILLPYLSGSGSNVLTKAIALRKDIICSNLPCFLDLRDRYPCFSTFDRSRPSDLKDQIVRLIDRSQREQPPYIYLETGIHEDLSFARQAKRQFELYQSLC